LIGISSSIPLVRLPLLPFDVHLPPFSSVVSVSVTVTLGMPKFVPDFSNKLSANALTLANQWIEWFRENAKGAWKGGPSEMEGWTSQQKCVFLERLLTFSKESGPFSIEILESLDLAYGLTASGNSEIKFRSCIYPSRSLLSSVPSR
jgi:hypothetical protein